MVLTIAMLPGAVTAQAIERNLPPSPTISSPTMPAPPIAEPSSDDVPIGPPLAAIVALAPDEPVRSGSGIDLGSARRLNTADARDHLQAFIGRPISRQLIAAIAARITLLYRRAGFPFVSVTTPEQEITAGILRFRLVEFSAGNLTVSGTRRLSADDVSRAVRWRGGTWIAASELSQDLAWINRVPFRHVSATFAPGAAFGTTDLTLDVVETRPWRAYGGYASSGTLAGGSSRLFFGIVAGGPRWLSDVFASYQFTASPAARDEAARYASHAAKLDLPIGPRAALTASFNHVLALQPIEAFASRQVVDEATIEYRAALPSRFVPGRWTGDLRFAIEARRVGGTVFFGSLPLLRTRLDVVQVAAGLSEVIVGSRGELTADASAYLGRRLAAGTLGSAVDGSLYSYVDGNLAGALRLSTRLLLSSRLSFQLTAAALPQSQQAAIGGPTIIRGYLLEDGAFDRSATLHTTLVDSGWRLPLLGGSNAINLSVFADVGIGSKTGGQTKSAASLGGGASVRLGTLVQASAESACALINNMVTQAGHCRVLARVSLLYG